MFMKLMSFGEIEYSPVGQHGEGDALGPAWRFRGPDHPGILDLFVETNGALPTPRQGTVYQINSLSENANRVESGLWVTTGSMIDGIGYSCSSSNIESKGERQWHYPLNPRNPVS